MSESAQPDDNLERLLDVLVDGTVSDAERIEFADRLRDDSAARTRYCDFMGLHVLMQLELAAPLQPPVVSPRLKSTSPVLGFLGRVTVALNRPVVWSILAVAIIFYGTFALFSWNLRPDKLLNGGAANDMAIAMMSDAVDVRWTPKTAPKPRFGSIHAGETLSIDAGLVQLELERGARLLVEGPAEWSVDGDNSVTLQRGRLVALVSPTAAGFTVTTPTAKIVDRGTEFAVEADKQGTTEVQVFKGRVELRPHVKQADSSSNQPPITLTAGDARRIEPTDKSGGVIVREIAPTPNRFTRQFSSDRSAAVRQIRIEGALASNTFGNTPEADVKHLIGGDGLNGDRHSAERPNTMWNTDFTHVKNVFVNFDLAWSYRLNSLKVWNYNETSTLWRGVKQADIYVSTSGKGDPLSEPREWKLIVADQQFASATGKADYSTPTVVPLGDVEGRFVSILIDEALGGHPHFPNGEHDCVGLSEVQIFGNRIERPIPPSKQK